MMRKKRHYKLCCTQSSHEIKYIITWVCSTKTDNSDTGGQFGRGLLKSQSLCVNNRISVKTFNRYTTTVKNGNLDYLVLQKSKVFGESRYCHSIIFDNYYRKMKELIIEIENCRV